MLITSQLSRREAEAGLFDDTLTLDEWSTVLYSGEGAVFECRLILSIVVYNEGLARTFESEM